MVDPRIRANSCSSISSSDSGFLNRSNALHGAQKSDANLRAAKVGTGWWLLPMSQIDSVDVKLILAVDLICSEFDDTFNFTIRTLCNIVDNFTVSP